MIAFGDLRINLQKQNQLEILRIVLTLNGSINYDNQAFGKNKLQLRYKFA